MKILSITFLLLASSLSAADYAISFLYTSIAEMASEPRITPSETKMEATFNLEDGTGELKYYSPYSDSFTLEPIKVRQIKDGILFTETKKNGIAITSFNTKTKEATYSNSTISYGTSMSYQLYGKGTVLQRR
jgi:hypothetical protein